MKVSLSSLNWDEYFGVKAEGGYGFPVDLEEVDSDDSSREQEKNWKSNPYTYGLG